MGDNMKKVFMSFMILIIVLAGCSSNGSKKIECTSGSEDTPKSKRTLFITGGEVTKLEQQLEFSYEMYQMTKEVAMVAFEANQPIEQEEGIIVSKKFGDKSVIIKATIDFAKVSKESIAETQFVLNDNGTMDLDSAISFFESVGETCKR